MEMAMPSLGTFFLNYFLYFDQYQFIVVSN